MKKPLLGQNVDDVLSSVGFFQHFHHNRRLHHFSDFRQRFNVLSGLAFRRNSSTGGADIIAKYVSKKDPLLNFFWINFAINAVIACVSFFVYAERDASGALQLDFKPVCLCLLYCLLSSIVGNAIIKGSKSAYKFIIITSHADEIDAEILSKLKHGATRIQATGAYSNASRDVIICVVNKRQIVEFRDILKKYPDTFAFVETVNETLGNFAKVK